MTTARDREERIERLARWLHETFQQSAVASRLGKVELGWDQLIPDGREVYCTIARELIDDPPDELFDCHTVG